MLHLAKRLWNDQAGFIISAELVLISTVGVIGLVTGLTCLRNAVNDELSDVACAIKSLDQSYCYTGFHSYKDKCSCVTKARTAGSTNIRSSYEEIDLVPVEDVAPCATTEHREGVIVNEKVINERIVSDRLMDEKDTDERVLDKPAADADCPKQTEKAPAPSDASGAKTPATTTKPAP